MPTNTIAREDGWRCFRVVGELDFELVGILARITKVLTNTGISIFAVSTFNTDYVLMKRENYDRGIAALKSAGYHFECPTTQKIAQV